MCYEYESFEKSRIAERLRKREVDSDEPTGKTASQIPPKQTEPERRLEDEPVPA